MVEYSFLLPVVRFGFEIMCGLFLVWMVWSMPFWLLRCLAGPRFGGRQLYRQAVKRILAYRCLAGPGMAILLLLFPIPPGTTDIVFVGIFTLAYDILLVRLLWRKRRVIRDYFVIRK